MVYYFFLDVKLALGMFIIVGTMVGICYVGHQDTSVKVEIGTISIEPENEWKGTGNWVAQDAPPLWRWNGQRA